MFRTKREGVSFVLAAVEAAFGSAFVRVYAVDGRFLTIGDAREEPLAVAAANWAATARAIAAYHPDALLVDVGTTTTDIIPIVGGTVAASGAHRSRPARLRRAGVHRRPPNSGRGDRQSCDGRGHPHRCLGGGVRAGRRRAPLARRSRSGRLHVPHARRPSRDPRVCRRAAGAGGVRRSRSAGRRRGVFDRRRAGRRAGGAHCRGDRTRAHASSVAANRGGHRPGRVSGGGGRVRGGDDGPPARRGARRCRVAVRARRVGRPPARAGAGCRHAGFELRASSFELRAPARAAEPRASPASSPQPPASSLRTPHSIQLSSRPW